MTPLYRQTFGDDLSLHDARVIAVDARRTDGKTVGTATFRIFDRATGADAERAFEYVVEFYGASEGFADLRPGMEIYRMDLTDENGTFRMTLIAAPRWDEVTFSFRRLMEKSLTATS